jgi:hypothetical protein
VCAQRHVVVLRAKNNPLIEFISPSKDFYLGACLNVFCAGAEIERLNKHTQIVARVAFHSSLARPAAVQRAQEHLRWARWHSIYCRRAASYLPHASKHSLWPRRMRKCFCSPLLRLTVRAWWLNIIFFSPGKIDSQKRDRSLNCDVATVKSELRFLLQKAIKILYIL